MYSELNRLIFTPFYIRYIVIQYWFVPSVAKLNGQRELNMAKHMKWCITASTFVNRSFQASILFRRNIEYLCSSNSSIGISSTDIAPNKNMHRALYYVLELNMIYIFFLLKSTLFLCFIAAYKSRRNFISKRSLFASFTCSSSAKTSTDN